jgi:hypothetical protein
MNLKTAGVDVVEQLVELDKILPKVAEVLPGALAVKKQSIKALLRAGADSPVNVKGDIGVYTTDKLLFARVVRIYGPDLDAIVKSFRVTPVLADGSNGTRLGFRVHQNKGWALANVECYLKGFNLSLEPGRKGVIISRIELTGYTLDQLEASATQTAAAINMREDLVTFSAEMKKQASDAETEKLSAETLAASLATRISAAKVQTIELEAELAALVVKRDAGKVEVDQAQKTVSDAKNIKQQLTSEIEALNRDIGNTKYELKELITQRRLISDEYSDFVTEGRGQARVYGWLSVIPTVAAVACIVCLIYGGWVYTTLAIVTPQQAYALFLQRAPFTSATILAVTLLLKLVSILIKKVINIHGERLTLAKLLVIARDAVFSSATGLKVDDEEIFRERVRTKIELLKAHLSAEGGAPYVLEGSLVDEELTRAIKLAREMELPKPKLDIS